MSGTTLAAQLLTQARATEQSRERLKLLHQVKELIVDKEPDLLDNFLEEMIDLNQEDVSPAVRQFVVYFILCACKSDPEVIPKVIGNLTDLLADENISVGKDAIRAFGSVYRFAVIWLAGRPLDDSNEATWREMNELRDMVFSLVESDNDGMRTNIIKVYESVIITLSTASKQSEMSRSTDYDTQFSIDRVAETHKLLKASKLKLEADTILQQLMTFTTSTEMSLANLTTALNSLIMIARQRPQFMIQIVNTIAWIFDVQLTKEKVQDERENPQKIDWQFRKYQLAGIRKLLKLQLLSLVQHGSARNVRPILVRILTSSWVKCSENFVNKFLPSGVSCKVLRQEASKAKQKNEKQMLKDKMRMSELKEDIAKSSRSALPDMDDGEEAPHDSIEEQINRLHEQLPKPLQEEEQIEMTRQALVQNLTPEVATNIVLLATIWVPDEMPTRFEAEYTPIGDITIAEQRENVSLLLAKLMTSVKIGPGAQKALEMQEQIDAREKEIREREKKRPGTKIVGPRRDLDRREVFHVGNKKDLRKKIQDKEKKKVSDKPGPRKVKPWNLITAAKKLSLNEKEDFGEAAVNRILKLKQKPTHLRKANPVHEYHLRLMQYRAANELHTRLLARLVSQFGGSLHSNLLDFLLEDPKTIPLKLDLCLQWLYDEFQMACDQAAHDVNVVYREESNYNTALCHILEILTKQGAGIHPASANAEQENIFTYVVLRAPLITSKAWREIERFCGADSGRRLNESTFLLQGLSKRKVKQNYHHIANIVVNCCTADTDDMTRIHAITEMTKIYTKANKNQRKVIEEYCLDGWLSYLEDEKPPQKLCNEDNDSADGWTDEQILRCLAYFLHITPLNPEKLLLDLAKLFANARSQNVQRAILRAIGPHVQQIGILSPSLVHVVKHCPTGAEMLIIRILHILTEDILADASALGLNKRLIPPALIEEVKRLYKRQDKRDVRFLTPVLAFLDYDEIIDCLPKIIVLPENHFRDAVYRICKSKHMSAPDLLVELNAIAGPNDDKEVIFNTIKAIKVCIMERTIFTTDVIAQTIQKLAQVFENPDEVQHLSKKARKSKTPPAFAMRTIIQALQIYPKLNNLIISCLQRMVKTGKVCQYDWIWEGFVKLVQRLHKSKTYPYDLVLTLPYEHFKKMCESFKKTKEMKEFRGNILTYMEHFKPDQYLDKRDYLKKALKKTKEREKQAQQQATIVLDADEIENKRAKIDESAIVTAATIAAQSGLPPPNGDILPPGIDTSIPPPLPPTDMFLASQSSSQLSSSMDDELI